MANTCTFAPTTTRALPSNYFFCSEGTVSSLFFDINSGRGVISTVSSWLSNTYNYLQCLHNSVWDKVITSPELTVTACEESSMLKAQNLFRLDEIAGFEVDWNGYGANAFSLDFINICKGIIIDLEFQPTIFPTGRQSIQFQYELQDRSYLEFEIFREKISCLEVPQRVYSNAHTFDFPISESHRIKEIVKKFYGQESSRD